MPMSVRDELPRHVLGDGLMQQLTESLADVRISVTQERKDRVSAMTSFEAGSQQKHKAAAHQIGTLATKVNALELVVSRLQAVVSNQTFGAPDVPAAQEAAVLRQEMHAMQARMHDLEAMCGAQSRMMSPPKSQHEGVSPSTLDHFLQQSKDFMVDVEAQLLHLRETVKSDRTRADSQIVALSESIERGLGESQEGQVHILEELRRVFSCEASLHPVSITAQKAREVCEAVGIAVAGQVERAMNSFRGEVEGTILDETQTLFSVSVDNLKNAVQKELQDIVSRVEGSEETVRQDIGNQVMMLEGKLERELTGVSTKLTGSHEMLEQRLTESYKVVDGFMSQLDDSLRQLEQVKVSEETMRAYCDSHINEFEKSVAQRVNELDATLGQRVQETMSSVDNTQTKLIQETQGLFDELKRELQQELTNISTTAGNAAQSIDGVESAVRQELHDRLNLLDGKVDRELTEVSAKINDSHTSMVELDRRFTDSYQRVDAYLSQLDDTMRHDSSASHTVGMGSLPPPHRPQRPMSPESLPGSPGGSKANDTVRRYCDKRFGEQSERIREVEDTARRMLETRIDERLSTVSSAVTHLTQSVNQIQNQCDNELATIRRSMETSDSRTEVGRSEQAAAIDRLKDVVEHNKQHMEKHVASSLEHQKQSLEQQLSSVASEIQLRGDGRLQQQVTSSLELQKQSLAHQLTSLEQQVTTTQKQQFDQLSASLSQQKQFVEQHIDTVTASVSQQKQMTDQQIEQLGTAVSQQKQLTEQQIRTASSQLETQIAAAKQHAEQQVGTSVAQHRQDLDRQVAAKNTQHREELENHVDALLRAHRQQQEAEQNAALSRHREQIDLHITSAVAQEQIRADGGRQQQVDDSIAAMRSSIAEAEDSLQQVKRHVDESVGGLRRSLVGSDSHAEQRLKTFEASREDLLRKFTALENEVGKMPEEVAVLMGSKLEEMQATLSGFVAQEMLNGEPERLLVQQQVEELGAKVDAIPTLVDEQLGVMSDRLQEIESVIVQQHQQQTDQSRDVDNNLQVLNVMQEELVSTVGQLEDSNRLIEEQLSLHRERVGQEMDDLTTRVGDTSRRTTQDETNSRILAAIEQSVELLEERVEEIPGQVAEHIASHASVNAETTDRLHARVEELEDEIVRAARQQALQQMQPTPDLPHEAELDLRRKVSEISGRIDAWDNAVAGLQTTRDTHTAQLTDLDRVGTTVAEELSKLQKTITALTEDQDMRIDDMGNQLGNLLDVTANNTKRVEDLEEGLLLLANVNAVTDDLSARMEAVEDALPAAHTGAPAPASPKPPLWGKESRFSSATAAASPASPFRRGSSQDSPWRKDLEKCVADIGMAKDAPPRLFSVEHTLSRGRANSTPMIESLRASSLRFEQALARPASPLQGSAAAPAVRPLQRPPTPSANLPPPGSPLAGSPKAGSPRTSLRDALVRVSASPTPASPRAQSPQGSPRAGSVGDRIAEALSAMQAGGAGGAPTRVGGGLVPQESTLANPLRRSPAARVPSGGASPAGSPLGVGSPGSPKTTFSEQLEQALRRRQGSEPGTSPQTPSHRQPKLSGKGAGVPPLFPAGSPLGGTATPAAGSPRSEGSPRLRDQLAAIRRGEDTPQGGPQRAPGALSRPGTPHTPSARPGQGGGMPPMSPITRLPGDVKARLDALEAETEALREAEEERKKADAELQTNLARVVSLMGEEVEMHSINDRVYNLDEDVRELRMLVGAEGDSVVRSLQRRVELLEEAQGEFRQSLQRLGLPGAARREPSPDTTRNLTFGSARRQPHMASESIRSHMTSVDVRSQLVTEVGRVLPSEVRSHALLSESRAQLTSEVQPMRNHRMRSMSPIRQASPRRAAPNFSPTAHGASPLRMVDSPTLSPAPRAGFMPAGMSALVLNASVATPPSAFLSSRLSSVPGTLPPRRYHTVTSPYSPIEDVTRGLLD